MVKPVSQFSRSLRHVWRHLIIVSLYLASALQTTAQMQVEQADTTYALDPVVVTASVTPTLQSQTSSSVTVINRDQIEAQNAVSVTDLLRQVPGLHVDQAGAPGSVSSVYTRGGDPNYTVVLIDGVKVNDPTNTRGGSFDFSTLNADAIERIEVVRGPLSAVYGSEALSGVINIITRQGQTQAVRQAEISGGPFGYFHTLLDVRGMLGAMDYGLGGSYVDDGEATEGSQLTLTTLNGNIGLSPSEALTLRTVFRYARSDNAAFPDDSGGPEFAALREVDRRHIQELSVGFSLQHTILEGWAYDIQIGLYNHAEDVASPGVAPGIRDPFGIPANTTKTHFQRYAFTWRNRFTLSSNATLALGVDAQIEDGSSRGTIDAGGFNLPTAFDLDRQTWAPFAEIQLDPLPGLHIEGSVRVDLPRGFDTEVSPRLGATYSLSTTGTMLRASWGKGFKLPSFFSLGNPIVGNTDLQPETSQGGDAGMTQTLWDERASVSVTYFYQRFDDAIDFDEGPPPQLVNRSEITTEGVEIGMLAQPLESLELTAHLTYLQTDIKGTDEALRNRPAWRGGANIQWRPISDLQLSCSALFVGETLDSSIPTGDQPLDAYTRIDVAATWKINATWQLFLRVDNLLDADYEEFVGFPAPGIWPRGGVRARF